MKTKYQNAAPTEKQRAYLAALLGVDVDSWRLNDYVKNVVGGKNKVSGGFRPTREDFSRAIEAAKS